MNNVITRWTPSDIMHLARIARDLNQGYLGIGEALEEFNIGAEVKRNTLRSLEQKCHAMIVAAGKVTTPKLKHTIADLKRMENLCRAERRRVSKMSMSNPFYGMSMAPRKITKAEKIQLKKKLAEKKQIVTGKKTMKFSPTLEQRVARLESIVEDAMKVVERFTSSLGDFR